MVRALAFHQCIPGSIPVPGVIWEVELLVGSLLEPGDFSAGTPVFPSLEKPALPNSNSTRNLRTHVERAPERS